jgi:hypothetical protein
LPEFVRHVKQLWEKSFHNENNQQPMRPASLAADSVVRALGHASIQTGWEHLKASFHQMSKVGSGHDSVRAVSRCVYLHLFVCLIACSHSSSAGQRRNP